MVQKKYKARKSKNLVIFIIGSSGFLGKTLYNYLKKFFIVKSINKSNLSKFKKRKCDILINANGNSKKYLSEKNFAKDFNLNVNSTVNFLTKLNYDKYIHISTIEVYNNTSAKNKTFEKTKIRPLYLSKYGFNKYLSELIVQKIASRWLILRLTGMVGEYMKKNPVFDMLNDQKLFVNLSSKFMFINTIEVSKIIHKLILKFEKNQIINIGPKNNIMLEYIANRLKYKTTIRNKLEKININVNTSKLQKIFKTNSSKITIKNYLKNFR